MMANKFRVRNKLYNRQRSLILFLILLLPIILRAQAFEPASTLISGAGRGDVSWCDYDNDHDLDVLISGRGMGDQRFTVLYRNDEGVFSDSGIPFIPLEESMTAWGDYDLDGDQDILMAGNSQDGDITRIFRNDGGDFVELDPGIAAIQQGVVLWVDVDGDNDLDIFISGNWITEIYINEGDEFSLDTQDFGYFSSSSACFGDYDNDGDLDLLLNGDSGAGAVTMIFNNDDGVFNDSGIELNGLMAGTCDWIDYDNDGDLDAAVSGYNDAIEANFYLYRNQGKQFQIVYAGIEGFAIGSADWGDYDNDGDADLVMSGKATGCGAIVSGIYRNDGNDFFYKISQEINTATRCSLGWADYDNDGDLDFLVSGLNYNEVPFAQLYMNTMGENEYTVNSAPGAPASLVSETVEDGVTFSWTVGTDSETPVTGLTYNLRIGTFPGGNDLSAPMADVSSGYRFIPSKGNVGYNLGWHVSGLDPGTYYWSVQAIDQALEGSVFAPEQSFTILTTGLDKEDPNENGLWVYPNPANEFIRIGGDKKEIGNEIIITDLSGRAVLILSPVQASGLINISSLKAGTYFVTVKGREYPPASLFVRHF